MNLWQPKIAPGDMSQPDLGGETRLWPPFSFNLSKLDGVEGVKVTSGIIYILYDEFFINDHDTLCYGQNSVDFSYAAGQLAGSVTPTYGAGDVFNDVNRSGYFIPFDWADVTATTQVRIKITRSADGDDDNTPVITSCVVEVGEPEASIPNMSTGVNMHDPDNVVNLILGLAQTENSIPAANNFTLIVNTSVSGSASRGDVAVDAGDIGVAYVQAYI